MAQVKIKTLSKIFSIQLRLKILILFLLISGFQSFEVYAVDEPLLPSDSAGSERRGAGYSSINAAPADLEARDGDRAHALAVVIVEPAGAAAAAQEDNVVVDPALLVVVDTRDAEAALDKLANFIYFHMGGDTRREVEEEFKHIPRIDSHLLTEAQAVIETGQFNVFFGDVLGKMGKLQKAAQQLLDRNIALRRENTDLIRAWRRALPNTGRPMGAAAAEDTVEALQRGTVALAEENASLKATNKCLKWGWGSTVVTAVVGAVAVVVLWFVK